MPSLLIRDLNELSFCLFEPHFSSWLLGATKLLQLEALVSHALLKPELRSLEGVKRLPSAGCLERRGGTLGRTGSARLTQRGV